MASARWATAVGPGNVSAAQAESSRVAICMPVQMQNSISTGGSGAFFSGPVIFSARAGGL